MRNENALACYHVFLNWFIFTSVTSVGSQQSTEVRITKLNQGMKKAQKEKAEIEAALINHEELQKNHNQLDGLQKQVS